MLTIAYADRGRPTLKDDERPFRYGLFRDFKMNAKMMPVSHSIGIDLVRVYFFHNKTFEEERLIIYMCKKNNLAAIFKNSIVI